LEERDLNYRVELQFALGPEGLHWSDEKGFLNTANPHFFQAYTELMRDLVGMVGDKGLEPLTSPV
jgi:hypothetical protein